MREYVTAFEPYEDIDMNSISIWMCDLCFAVGCDLSHCDYLGECIDCGCNLSCHLKNAWHSPMIISSDLSFSPPIPSLHHSISIHELDPLSPANVNRSAPVTPPLLLVLLLRKALSLRHTQILMCPIRIVVRAVRIRSHLRVYGGVLRNALEGRVLLLRELGGFRRGRG